MLFASNAADALYACRAHKKQYLLAYSIIYLQHHLLAYSVIAWHTASQPLFLTPALIPHTSPHFSYQPSFLTPALTSHTSPHYSHKPSLLTPALVHCSSPHSAHQPSSTAAARLAFPSDACNTANLNYYGILLDHTAFTLALIHTLACS